MVLAAALISLAVLAPQAPSQAARQAATQAKPQAERQTAPTDDPKPYTVEGVRRAIAAGDQPAIDNSRAEPARRGYRVAIDSRAINPDPCSLVVTACQPAWGGGANPTWHDQFMAMTGPHGLPGPLHRDEQLPDASGGGLEYRHQPGAPGRRLGDSRPDGESTKSK